MCKYRMTYIRHVGRGSMCEGLAMVATEFRSEFEAANDKDALMFAEDEWNKLKKKHNPIYFLKLEHSPTLVDWRPE